MISNNLQLIHEFLELSAEKYPDKIALIHKNVRATYEQINAQANRLAKWLVNQGVNRGDRVVMLLENSLEYVVSYYGILKCAGVVVPLDPNLKPNSLEPLLAELEQKVIITYTKPERTLIAANPGLVRNSKLLVKDSKGSWDSTSISITDWNDVISKNKIDNPLVAMSSSDIACIIYTSGSTGVPKGVMLSHGNIVSNTRSICHCLKLTDNDIQMVVLPFFYVMGKSLLNTHFAVGGTIVINNGFAFPASVIKQMADENVTGFSGVPSTYAYLLHRSPLEKYREKLNSMRYCSQAGGHMPKQLKIGLRRVMPNHTDIYIMYGATEASARLTVLNPEHFYDKMGSIGEPLPGVKIRILDDNGLEVAAGKVGELVASGPNIMKGYLNDKDTTEKVLNKDGYHTGDLGYADNEGFFYVVGRKDNLIKVGGHRINPIQIEEALMETGLLGEAVVIGKKDDLLGYKLVALVVPKASDCCENGILCKCKECLPKHKIPAKIIITRVLPKKTSGKIDHSVCHDLANQCVLAETT